MVGTCSHAVPLGQCTAGHLNTKASANATRPPHSQPGELTDQGRATTLALGQRFRHLYINQLNFLPDLLAHSTTVTLRSTPIPRALQSVQQAFHGLYPPKSRLPSCPTPTITARSMAEETLFPNTGACKRFGELFDLFADRAAGRWNDSPEMEHLNRKMGKWMPEGEHKRIKLDGKPRVSGIMDTVNASLAHDDTAGTRLPAEFYDDTSRRYIDRMACDEWYTGYSENREYRMLGMGALINDMTTRMIWHVEGKDLNGEARSKGAESSKLWLAGAHDTTLAGMLSSLGAYGDTPWPPFTSHVAVELFSRNDAGQGVKSSTIDDETSPKTPTAPSHSSATRWWSPSSIPFLGTLLSSSAPPSSQLATKPTADLTPSELAQLNSHFVRIRYNDRPMPIPGCKGPGRHLEGDESFCTLRAFREIVEGFAPREWRRQCGENLGRGVIADGKS